MPVVKVEVECGIRESFRVEQVRGMFDLPVGKTSRATFAAELPAADEEWRIGAIVGPSGSGKSTLARAAYGERLYCGGPWPEDEAVIDALGEHSTRRIVQVLSAVGMASPPAWLRPFRVLSGGEQFRCELARALLGADGETGSDPSLTLRVAGPGRADEARNLVVFDEFTSVVDRTVAAASAAALGKAIRGGTIASRFVAVSCHYDVLSWLGADWVLDLATGALSWGRLRRERIELEVFRCRHEAWRLFAAHHYLSGAPPKVAECYLAVWRERPVALCAAMGIFGYPGRKRIMRLVTLPDYQGLGIGMRLAEHVAAEQQEAGFRVSITASHPAVLGHCDRSRRWRLARVSRGGEGKRQRCGARRFGGGRLRSVATFEYCGGDGDDGSAFGDGGRRSV